jgi:SAM-dependent methyltransferase
MSTKAMQGQLWSVAPQFWSRHFEPYFMPIYREVVKQLHLTEETMLLDAGCGSGLFTNVAARTGAQVMGVDAARGLLQIARLRNPGINFLEEDLEVLPFADSSFHAVTAFNSFQYAGQFENALIEAKRVLKKYGRLVIGIWDLPENSDATAILKAIGSLLPPPPPGTPGPFALSEEGKIDGMCTRNGLKLIYKDIIACPMLFHSENEAVKSFMGTGPAASALKAADKGLVEKTIARAFEPFKLTEDMYFLQNRFKVFIAEK